MKQPRPVKTWRPRCPSCGGTDVAIVESPTLGKRIYCFRCGIA
ncbi:MAG: hypothetical protein ACE5GD_00010 [Candidatus Geothermarchaeales archaeon]